MSKGVILGQPTISSMLNISVLTLSASDDAQCVVQLIPISAFQMLRKIFLMWYFQ